jgi:hypothetical protein
MNSATAAVQFRHTQHTQHPTDCSSAVSARAATVLGTTGRRLDQNSAAGDAWPLGVLARPWDPYSVLLALLHTASCCSRCFVEKV